MKTNTTPEQIKTIRYALEKINIHFFREEADNPLVNAQRNLNGRTFFYTENNMRHAKCRVLSSTVLHGGLLFQTICSDVTVLAGGREHRHFRAVVHDLFGTCVFRPNLQEMSATKLRAQKVCEEEEIDLLGHYRNAVTHEMRQAAKIAADLGNALFELCQSET